MYSPFVTLHTAQRLWVNYYGHKTSCWWIWNSTANVSEPKVWSFLLLLLHHRMDVFSDWNACFSPCYLWHPHAFIAVNLTTINKLKRKTHLESLIKCKLQGFVPRDWFSQCDVLESAFLRRLSVDFNIQAALEMRNLCNCLRVVGFKLWVWIH